MADPALTAAAEVVRRAEMRQSEQQRRIYAYETYLAAIFGSSDEGAPPPIIPNFADGRPSMRLSASVTDGWKQRDTINLLPSTIDTFVSMRGQMPTSAVVPEGSDQAQLDQATKRTRALREQHDHSKLPKQMKTLAFNAVALGEWCVTLEPRTKADVDRDTDTRRPIGVYVSSVSPKNAFPGFRFGTPGDPLDDLYCIWNLTPEAIKTAYNIDVAEPTNVIHYFSRTEKQILVGTRRISGVVHNLGFCPAVWGVNKETDGRDAQSDIRNAIAIHEQMGVVMNIYLDSLMWSTWPIVHIKNRQYVTDIQIGPGAVIETVDPGGVDMVSPAGTPQNALTMLGALTDAFHQVTGISPIQTDGVIDRSNVSARSVDRQQGPMEQRIVLENDLFGDSFEEMNEKILLMLSNVDGLKNEQMPMFGQDKGKTYSDTFTGEDIGGWIRNTVKWDATLGSSKHERLVMGLQLNKDSMGLYPLSRVMADIGIDDWEQVMGEGLAELKLVQQAQQMMQPQAPPGAPPGQGGTPPGGPPGPAGNGDPNQTGQDAVAIAGGGSPDGGGPPPDAGAGPVQPPPPPAQMPNFPPIAASPGGPQGSPAQVPDIASIVEQAVAGLRLHGDITQYHGGPGGSILVLVNDHRDIFQVRQAIQALAGGLSVTVKMDPNATASASNGTR
jgi:hypothetical protein